MPETNIPLETELEALVTEHPEYEKDLASIKSMNGKFDKTPLFVGLRNRIRKELERIANPSIGITVDYDNNGKRID